MLETEPEQCVNQLRNLADHFAEKDKEKSLRFAEEGIARARSLGQPERTNEMVRWGQMVARLGNKDAAKKLIEEAADTSDRWKPNQRYDDTIGRIATAIAPYDSARAVAMLKKLSNEYYQQSYRGQVALALDDLNQVKVVLKDVDPDTMNDICINWAYRVAPSRPADAVKAVEGLKDVKAASMIACFARLAELIGVQDKALTCSLIDRSTARMFQAKPEENESVDPRTLADRAARLAVVAGKVGYGDMEGLVLKTLALRPTPGESDSPIPCRTETVKIARVLALTDPSAAKPMLESLESGSETIQDWDAWICAWALVDPKHAAEIAEKELSRAKSSDESEDAIRHALYAVRICTSSSEERFNAVLPDFGHPGEYRNAYGIEFDEEMPIP